MRRRDHLAVAGLLLFIAAALSLGQLSGCGGGGGTPAGTLQVGITDSPAFLDFSSVHIKVVKVAVVPAGRENLPDTDPGLPVIADFTGIGGVDVNILKLHFLQQLLGTAVVPPGSYTQVRLILAANPATAPFNNYFILAGSSTPIALTTPSAQETGVKIVGHFTVTAGTLNTILLEFNPDTAIVKAGQSGQNNLKPTGIHIQQIFTALNMATGSISGTIRSPAFATWSSATVSIVPRNPAAPAIVSGDVFSNFSSPSVWKAPFIAYVPPTSSPLMPSQFYKVFVSVVNPAGKFQLYSSPAVTVTVNTPSTVPPAGTANLTLGP
jgi:hypothetical protein